MKYYSMRIDEEMLEKLRYIAKHEYRSVNKMVMIIIREYVSEFEKRYGRIKID